jgi:hypothetical protein
MGYHDGSASASDRHANAGAVFYPAVDPENNNGSYALPCIEIGGVQVYAYVRDGILVISVDYDTADVSDGSPFRVYDGQAIPTVINVTDAEPVWEALPDNAISEDDARILRRTSDLRPGDWVIPGWLNEKMGG